MMISTVIAIVVISILATTVVAFVGGWIGHGNYKNRYITENPLRKVSGPDPVRATVQREYQPAPAIPTVVNIYQVTAPQGWTPQPPALNGNHYIEELPSGQWSR